MQFDLPEVWYDEPTSDTLKQLGLPKVADRALFHLYLRTILSERQNHKCCYCGTLTTTKIGSRFQASLEHVIPRAFGGATDLENCVMACSRCNNNRGSKQVYREMIIFECEEVS